MKGFMSACGPGGEKSEHVFWNDFPEYLGKLQGKNMWMFLEEYMSDHNLVEVR